MQTHLAGRERTLRYNKRAPNRRSLLAVVSAAIGTLFVLPARAHPDNGVSDAQTQTFCDLKRLGAGCQVDEIRHRSGVYRVVTADGRRTEFSETDLRFKIDSSRLGPGGGKPVILPAGQVGDRAWVFFAAPEEISPFIKHQC